MKNVFQAANRWLQTVFEERKNAQQKNTIAVLDGVRALAIIFVISFHITASKTDGRILPWQSDSLTMSILTAGGTGVTLFFVLSGFLLFMPYAKSLLFASRWPLARTFYLRRALRIMPGYYISLLILVLLSARQYLQPVHINNPGHYLSFMLDASQPTHPANLGNLALFAIFFMDSSRQTFRLLDGPYWTLGTEWQFYMILPLIALGIMLLVKRVPLNHRLRAVTFCLFGVIALGLFVRYFGQYFLDNPGVTFLVPRPVLNVVLFFTFGITGKYIEDFAVGMLASLCYIYAQNLPSEHRFPRALRKLSPWLWSAGILILVFSAMWHFQSDKNTPAWPFLGPIMPVYHWLAEMLLAWGFGMCIMAILFGSHALQRPFAWKPLRWIGLISYSLYIWHEPLLDFFHDHVLPLFPGLVNPAIASPAAWLSYALYWLWALVVIVPFCFCTYVLIEKPGMKLGDRWRKAIDARHRARLDDTKADRANAAAETGGIKQEVVRS